MGPVERVSIDSTRVSRRAVMLGSAAAVLAACGADPVAEPRALTSAEAERFATARFRLFRQGSVPVHMVWPGSPGATIDAVLVLNQAFGYGMMSTEAADGAAAVERALIWSPERVGSAGLVGERAPGPGDGSWGLRTLSTANRQDLFLGLALNLGSDRPENPLLLRRSSARFLRTEELDGTEADIFEGPRPAGDTSSSRTRYWVDRQGNLRRFEAYLGDVDGRYASVTVVKKVDLPAGLKAAAGALLQVRPARG